MQAGPLHAGWMNSVQENPLNESLEATVSPAREHEGAHHLGVAGIRKLPISTAVFEKIEPVIRKAPHSLLAKDVCL